MMAIFTKLRRAALMPPNGSVQDDVVFAKTPNTVTMVSAKPRRKLQIITRLYAKQADILNGYVHTTYLYVRVHSLAPARRTTLLFCYYTSSSVFNFIRSTTVSG